MCLNVFEIFAHIKCYAIHHHIRFAVYKFELYMFRRSAHQFACAVVVNILGYEHRFLIAGAKGIPFLEAEKLKKDPAEHQGLLPIVRPVFEKMGSIVKKSIEGHKVDTIYLVGGTCCFEGVEGVMQKQLGITVVKPDNPMLVTPLGIALGSMIEGSKENSLYEYE